MRYSTAIHRSILLGQRRPNQSLCVIVQQDRRSIVLYSFVFWTWDICASWGMGDGVWMRRLRRMETSRSEGCEDNLLTWHDSHFSVTYCSPVHIHTPNIMHHRSYAMHATSYILMNHKREASQQSPSSERR